MNNLKGVGIDIFEKKRMEAALAKASSKMFLKKILNPSEIKKHCGQKNAHLKCSVVFALKEAVLKAFGMGWNAYANFCDINIGLQGRKAVITLSGKTAKLAFKKGVKKIIADYSVSHRHVVAVVALLK
jgi:phosphopantetheine--protein transferase-like protein